MCFDALCPAAPCWFAYTRFNDHIPLTNARPAPSESRRRLDAGQELGGAVSLTRPRGAAWSTNLNWLSPDLDCKTCKQAAPAEHGRIDHETDDFYCLSLLFVFWINLVSCALHSSSSSSSIIFLSCARVRRTCSSGRYTALARRQRPLGHDPDADRSLGPERQPGDAE